MEKAKKKEYSMPEVIDYGDVAELTRNAGQANSDGQGDNTACESPFCSAG